MSWVLNQNNNDFSLYKNNYPAFVSQILMKTIPTFANVKCN